jgi:conjugal transfer/entry exclusion protein
MSNRPPLTDHSSASQSLVQALDKNEAVEEVVTQSAEELLVINAVLNKEIPGHVMVGDVAQALQKTDELEVKIYDTAQELAQVNQVLSREIDERADLELELAATKAALARAQCEGQGKGESA